MAPTSTLDARAKAIAGDRTRVVAEVIRDGHDVVAAAVRWLDPGAEEWNRIPLAPTEEDIFEGEVRFAASGIGALAIEAWTDRYATWRRDIARWEGSDLLLELAGGAALLEELATGLDADARRRVLDAASVLGDTSCSTQARLAAGLDDAVAACLAGVPDPLDWDAAPAVEIRVERPLARCGAWYEVFPRSVGGLKGVTAMLPDLAALGFDVVYLPPVHPIGTTHRKGRHGTLVAGPDDPGSPWAIGSEEGGHEAVEASIGSVDDVVDLAAAAQELGIDLALDLAFQCSPDHPWVSEHPEWFAHRADGSIRYAENPPKKYQDIHPLDLWCALPHRGDLWAACRHVVEEWVQRGVSVFRVDNPHTKPLPFWKWLIDDIWSRHPEVVFLAEAFTKPSMMYELARVGFSQGYTYFTWRTSPSELRSYVEELRDGPESGWFRPNFWPATPDILSGPLRRGSRSAFEARLVAAALLSPSYGIYSGYELCENTPQSPDNEEFFDSEKYRVVDRPRPDLDDADASLFPLIVALNAVRRGHPAIRDLRNLRFVDVDDSRLLAWTWQEKGGAPPILVIVNLSPDEVVETLVHLDPGRLGVDPAGYRVSDLLTGESWSWGGGSAYVKLDPTQRAAHVLELTAEITP